MDLNVTLSDSPIIMTNISLLMSTNVSNKFLLNFAKNRPLFAVDALM